MAKYEIDSMLKDGYAKNEILEYIAKEEKYDLEKMREDGYDDETVFQSFYNEFNVGKEPQQPIQPTQQIISDTGIKPNEIISLPKPQPIEQVQTAMETPGATDTIQIYPVSQTKFEQNPLKTKPEIDTDIETLKIEILNKESFFGNYKPDNVNNALDNIKSKNEAIQKANNIPEEKKRQSQLLADTVDDIKAKESWYSDDLQYRTLSNVLKAAELTAKSDNEIINQAAEIEQEMIGISGISNKNIQQEEMQKLEKKYGDTDYILRANETIKITENLKNVEKEMNARKSLNEDLKNILQTANLTEESRKKIQSEISKLQSEITKINEYKTKLEPMPERINKYLKSRIQEKKIKATSTPNLTFWQNVGAEAMTYTENLKNFIAASTFMVSGKAMDVLEKVGIFDERTIQKSKKMLSDILNQNLKETDYLYKTLGEGKDRFLPAKLIDTFTRNLSDLGLQSANFVNQGLTLNEKERKRLRKEFDNYRDFYAEKTPTSDRFLPRTLIGGFGMLPYLYIASQNKLLSGALWVTQGADEILTEFDKMGIERWISVPVAIGGGKVYSLIENITWSGFGKGANKILSNIFKKNITTNLKNMYLRKLLNLGTGILTETLEESLQKGVTAGIPKVTTELTNYFRESKINTKHISVWEDMLNEGLNVYESMIGTNMINESLFLTKYGRRRMNANKIRKNLMNRTVDGKAQTVEMLNKFNEKMNDYLKKGNIDDVNSDLLMSLQKSVNRDFVFSNVVDNITALTNIDDLNNLRENINGKAASENYTLGQISELNTLIDKKETELKTGEIDIKPTGEVVEIKALTKDDIQKYTDKLNELQNQLLENEENLSDKEVEVLRKQITETNEILIALSEEMPESTDSEIESINYTTPKTNIERLDEVNNEINEINNILNNERYKTPSDEETLNEYQSRLEALQVEKTELENKIESEPKQELEILGEEIETKDITEDTTKPETEIVSSEQTTPPLVDETEITKEEAKDLKLKKEIITNKISKLNKERTKVLNQDKSDEEIIKDLKRIDTEIETKNEELKNVDREISLSEQNLIAAERKKEREVKDAESETITDTETDVEAENERKVSKERSFSEFGKDITETAVKGKDVKIATQDGDVDAYYAVVPLSSLIPSHDPITFDKNPNSPLQNQERKYHTDKAEQIKVIDNERNYNPDQTLTPAVDATTGAPMTSENGIVFGGTSRVLTLMRLFQNNPAKYKEYVAEMKKRSQSYYNIENVSDVDNIPDPVLVRIVKGKVDKKGADRLVRMLQEGTTQGLPLTARAVSKSKMLRLSSEWMIKNIEDFDSFRDLLNDDKSRDLIKLLQRDGVLTPQDLNIYINSLNGLLNEQGKDLVENIFLGLFINNADLIDALTKKHKRELSKVLKLIPTLLQLKKYEGYDLTSLLNKALFRILAFDSSKAVYYKDFLGTTGLFKELDSDNYYADILAETLLTLNTKTILIPFNEYLKYAKESEYKDGAFDFVQSDLLTPEQAFEKSFDKAEIQKKIAEEAKTKQKTKQGIQEKPKVTEKETEKEEPNKTKNKNIRYDIENISIGDKALIILNQTQYVGNVLKIGSKNITILSESDLYGEQEVQFKLSDLKAFISKENLTAKEKPDFQLTQGEKKDGKETILDNRSDREKRDKISDESRNERRQYADRGKQAVIKELADNDKYSQKIKDNPIEIDEQALDSDLYLKFNEKFNQLGFILVPLKDNTNNISGFTMTIGGKKVIFYTDTTSLEYSIEQTLEHELAHNLNKKDKSELTKEIDENTNEFKEYHKSLNKIKGKGHTISQIKEEIASDYFAKIKKHFGVNIENTLINKASAEKTRDNLRSEYLGKVVDKVDPRNFKTAEEYVVEKFIRHISQNQILPKKQNDITFYHGTDILDYKVLSIPKFEKEIMDRNYGNYFYITPDRNLTTAYGRYTAAFNIPKEKILSLKDLRNDYKKLNDKNIDFDDFTDKQFEKYWAIEMPDNEYIVKNVDKIRDYTKTQLVSEWEKANSQQTPFTEADIIKFMAKDFGVSEEQLKKEFDAVKSQYENTDKWLKAPNGKESNLSEHLWVMVRTPRFKEWFGDIETITFDKNGNAIIPDNVSKVVDSNGEPLITFHGTDEKFNVFDTNKSKNGWLGKGFYFTINKKYAKENGKNIFEIFLNIKKLFIVKGDAPNDVLSEIQKIYPKADDFNLSKILKDNGYDGIFFKHWDIKEMYSAFNPSQIKSITNVGSFSAETDDIRYMTAGEESLKNLSAEEKKIAELNIEELKKAIEDYKKETGQNPKDTHPLIQRLMEIQGRSGFKGNPTRRATEQRPRNVILQEDARKVIANIRADFFKQLKENKNKRKIVKFDKYGIPYIKELNNVPDLTEITNELKKRIELNEEEKTIIIAGDLSGLGNFNNYYGREIADGAIETALSEFVNNFNGVGKGAVSGSPSGDEMWGVAHRGATTNEMIKHIKNLIIKLNNLEYKVGENEYVGLNGKFFISLGVGGFADAEKYLKIDPETGLKLPPGTIVVDGKLLNQENNLIIKPEKGGVISDEAIIKKPKRKDVDVRGTDKEKTKQILESDIESRKDSAAIRETSEISELSQTSEQNITDIVNDAEVIDSNSLTQKIGVIVWDLMKAGYNKAFEIVNKIKSLIPENTRNKIAKFNEYIYKAYNMFKPLLDKINIGLTIKFTPEYINSVTNKNATENDMKNLKPVHLDLQNKQRNIIESYLAKKIDAVTFESQLYQSKAEFDASLNNYFDKNEEESPVYIPKQSVKKIKLSRLFQRVITGFSDDAKVKEASPKYSQVTLEDDLMLAVDLVENDYDRALRIIRNTEKAPVNILKTNIAIAAYAEAGQRNNIDDLNEIIIKTSLRSTRGGQEIAAVKGFGDRHSAARYIKKVLDNRMADALMKSRVSFGFTQNLTKEQTQSKIADKLLNQSFTFIDNLKEKSFKLIDWLKTKICK